MSSIIIGKIEGLKLKNGKIIPFVLSASSNVRVAGNLLAWDWHNISLDGKSSFIFERAEELRPKIEEWASQGMFKWRNGGFVSVEGMMRKLSEAFKKPVFHFMMGILMVSYIQVSKDRTKAKQVVYIPLTEEDFLAYLEKNKNRSLKITILPPNPYNESEILTALYS